MGNCLAITSNPPRSLPEQEEPNELEEDYGHHIITTTRSTTPYLGTPDPMVSGTGTRTGQSSPSKVLDPRLVSLLDFFRQLYARRSDIFNRIIPAHREAFEDIFNKMGVNIDDDKKKGRKLLMQRSNSFGDVEGVRLRRFKVKPIDSGGATPPDGGGSAPGGSSGGGGGGGGTNKPGGSK